MKNVKACLSISNRQIVVISDMGKVLGTVKEDKHYPLINGENEKE